MKAIYSTNKIDKIKDHLFIETMQLKYIVNVWINSH